MTQMILDGFAENSNSLKVHEMNFLKVVFLVFFFCLQTNQNLSTKNLASGMLKLVDSLFHANILYKTAQNPSILLE